MPKKPNLSQLLREARDEHEYKKMQQMFVEKRAATRQGMSPRDDKETKRAALMERFDKQQTDIKSQAAKKEAQNIGQQLGKALKSLTPRSPRSPKTRGQGGPSMSM